MPDPALRSQRLDVLRFVAVLLVLGNHLPPPPPGTPLGSLGEAWIRGGWVGVDLFFVLSGYLVSGLLFEEHRARGHISASRFLIRRGLKIYPAFWVLIAFSVIAASTFDRQPALLAKTVSELLFVQNYFVGLWNHTWSLAVEEHFYLLLVLLLGVLARRKDPDPFTLLPALFLALALGSLILRLLAARALPYAHPTHLFPTHLRMDSLFAGVLLSYLHHHRAARLATFSRGREPVLLGLGLLAFLPAFLFARETTPFLYTFGYTLFYLGACCLLLALTASRTPHPVMAIPAYLGARSYSIYLWHMPVAIWLAPRLEVRLQRVGLTPPWIVYVLLYVLASLAFGVFMSRLVELPVLGLRDRLFPSRRAQG